MQHDDCRLLGCYCSVRGIQENLLFGDAPFVEIGHAVMLR